MCSCTIDGWHIPKDELLFSALLRNRGLPGKSLTLIHRSDTLSHSNTYGLSTNTTYVHYIQSDLTFPHASALDEIVDKAREQSYSVQ